METITDLKYEIVNKLIDNGNIESICSEYGEQGYELEEGKKAILFANWNDFDDYPNFMEWLENNYEIEWFDEWIIDYNESKAYRTSPDSYSWQQQFRITDDGELITPDSDIEEWIDYCKVDTQTNGGQMHCLPSFIDTDELINSGFKLVSDDNESGWYGRTDDPEIIADDLFNEGYAEVIFILSSVGQFAVNFDVWARK